MKHLLPCFVVTWATILSAAASQTEAARAVIERFTGKRFTPAELRLETIPAVDGRHVYEIADNGRTIRGSGAVALCKGFYMNAKSKGAAISSWSGNRFDAEAAFAPSKDVRVVSPYRHYQYFNVVTFGYTMPYWNEERWMQEIDWMALHGFDMPLALIANEAIAERVWKRLGLTEEEIAAYFVGPAHLPWMRMGNLCRRPDAPQPAAWRRRSVRLQHAVLKRMRELGMKSVVNGFAGFVPDAITRVRPEAKILRMKWCGGAFHGWFLSPEQPLFREIGRMYVEEWEKEFGRCDYYLADSFNEMDLPWKTKEAKLEGLAKCGKNVYSAIADAAPHATWVMQGWMFGYQRHIWNTETLGALLRDVPKERVLLLDMAVDYNLHFWRNRENRVVFKGFLDRPWVWSTIPNMGGKSGPTGVLEFYANGHLPALHAADRGRLVGYGTAPEGIENNEVVYELISDAGWRSEKTDVKAWLRNYSRCRYGAAPARMDAYWDGMLKSVYGGFTDHPRFCWQTAPGGTRGSIQFNDRSFEAWKAFLDCAGELKDSPLYRIDLREQAAFCAGAKLELLLRAEAAARESGVAEDVARIRRNATALFKGIDAVLREHPTLNLGRWIRFAREAAGGDAALADYYETNARRLVTIWGPPVDDYAAKIWSGLAGSYYLKRHQLRWAAIDGASRADIRAFEREWVEKRLPVSEAGSRACDGATLMKAALATETKAPKTEGRTVGEWTPADIKTGWTTLSFNVPAADLKAAKRMRLRYTSGNHGINFTEVKIVMDGVAVQSFTVDGFAGNSSRNNVFALDIPKNATGNNSCVVTVKAKGSNGTNSNGVLELLGGDRRTKAHPMKNAVPCSPVEITTAHGRTFTARGGLKETKKILKGDPGAARLSERVRREALVAAQSLGPLKISYETYTAAPRMNVPGKERISYVRRKVTLTNPTAEGIALERLYLLKNAALDAGRTYSKTGNTDGAVIRGDAKSGSSVQWIALEHPMAKYELVAGEGGDADVLSAYVPVVDTLRPGESMTFSLVTGTCGDAGQFRRAFATYLDRERAHPYRVLPHYNSWYDLCINRNDAPVARRFTREEALASMRAFRTELWEKRKVFINSYLWDDGWDDFDSLWGFNANFPNGFKELADEAHRVPGASIAAWMSPFGGYGGSFARRLAYAKKNGIVDRNAPGMQLSKPKYYAAFRDRVLQMIKDYDMNLFKFDRMGSGSDADGAADRYAADLRAVGNLCGEMRAAKQDVFINCTVGTWASPYWLMWCDSIWKGHNDCDALGRAGTARQRWVTYRDNVIHDRFVAKSPLYPLNSLMMHGIIVCRSSPHNTMTDYKGTGPHKYRGEGYSTPTACADFASEVWMSVALGTGLQEYYITPRLMSETWWDILADGVKWLKTNESVLMDSHWIGGDPGKGAHYGNTRGPAQDVYGFAALGAKKGVVILRNPSDKPQTFALCLDKVLEMPRCAKGSRFRPAVVFNSSAQFENEGSAGAFKPVWPADTAKTVDWTLPAFCTILFEIKLR